jgi:hypothetical protein
MWKKALALFDKMEKRGIEPTEVTYSVTISALGSGLQWERALQLLNVVSLYAEVFLDQIFYCRKAATRGRLFRHVHKHL